MSEALNTGEKVVQPKSKALQKAEAYFNGKYDQLLSLGGKSNGGLLPKVVHELMESIEDLVKANYQGITSAQIRKVFGIFKQLESENPLEIVKLKYKLDYLLARQKNDANAAVLIALIKDMIDRIARTEDEKIRGTAIESFYTVMEAIVAYHKYFEELNPNKGK